MSGWVSWGHVSILDSTGQKLLLDKQDVAYCAYVYHQRKGRGKRVFDANGAPYKSKSDIVGLAGLITRWR